MEGTLFKFTTENFRVRIQSTLLMTFLKNGAELRASENYWTKLCIRTGNSASVVVFKWSPAHISLSFCVCFGLTYISLHWYCWYRPFEVMGIIGCLSFLGVVFLGGGVKWFLCTCLTKFIVSNFASPLLHLFNKTHCRCSATK